jgi:hypothetical protein
LSYEGKDGRNGHNPPDYDADANEEEQSDRVKKCASEDSTLIA